jgi:hypothetical protein
MSRIQWLSVMCGLDPRIHLISKQTVE